MTRSMIASTACLLSGRCLGLRESGLAHAVRAVDGSPPPSAPSAAWALPGWTGTSPPLPGHLDRIAARSRPAARTAHCRCRSVTASSLAARMAGGASSSEKQSSPAVSVSMIRRVGHGGHGARSRKVKPIVRAW